MFYGRVKISGQVPHRKNPSGFKNCCTLRATVFRMAQAPYEGSPQALPAKDRSVDSDVP